MKKQILLFTAFAICCGCAGRVQPPSAAHPNAPSRPSRPVREEFDPQSLREDLLLIQPTFSAQPAAAPLEETETTLPEAPSPSSGETPAEETATREIYRVQLMALSNGDVARQRRTELESDLGVPVHVEPEHNLFMVRAGEYPTVEEAERLREQIIAFSAAYADAYVVADRASASLPPAAVDNAEEELPLEPAVPDDPPPVLVPAFGWRVLIDKVDSYREAQRLKRVATDRLGRTDIDVTFKTPYYNVEVGHFRTKLEAQQALERIKGRYPNALILPTQILVPKGE